MAREVENDITPKEEAEIRTTKSFLGFSRNYQGGTLGEKESTRDREKRRAATRRVLTAVAAVIAFAAAYIIVSTLLDISYIPI